jgi:DNA invertase Pin-like site-specific DNA recombinase
MGKAKRAALYLRVSTNGQTVENQRRELTAAAQRHGWEVVAVFSDQGISGKNGREKRPGFDSLYSAISRRECDLVASWSVDRLGRSLQHLVGFLGELHAKKVDLYLHQQGVDTSTPAGKALFQMMGVFAEFERAMIVERINAGLARAKANGVVLGRPRVGKQVEDRARKELAKGTGVVKTARLLGIGTGTVQRVKREMAARDHRARAR